jgi:hypothetical protein
MQLSGFREIRWLFYKIVKNGKEEIMSLTISRISDSDISQIMNIQFANQRDKLTPSQQKNGYFPIAFSADECKNFNDRLCVVVAKEHHKVIGYCCVSSAAFNAQFPILDQIVKAIPSYVILETQEMLIEEKSCIYGPVCIALSHRGKGVLEKLSASGLEIAKEQGYIYCFSFIAADNVRSLSAPRKLSFHTVGSVNHNNNEYIVIARQL